MLPEKRMEITTNLSDGDDCTVRVLGLYELHTHVPIEQEGLKPYYEEVKTAGGSVQKHEYIPPEAPPSRPQVPRNMARPGTPEYEQWIDYDLYQGYLQHQRTNVAIHRRHLWRVRNYILENCLEPEDRRRVVTEKDWRAIEQAAISSQLRGEDVVAAIRDTFPG